MRAIRTGLFAALTMGLMGIGTTAWACQVDGLVLCASDQKTAVSGVDVTFTPVGGGEIISATSDIWGYYVTHIAVSTTYDVNLLAVDAVCDTEGTAITLPTILVDDALQCPGTPPPAGADCSPGYYKNHPETWCVQCGFASVCGQMVSDLSARGPGSAEIRDAAKALIDACFVTADRSPCSDD